MTRFKSILLFIPFVFLVSCPTEIIKNTSWSGSGDYSESSMLVSNIINATIAPSLTEKMKVSTDIQFKDDSSVTVEITVTSTDGSTPVGAVILLEGTYQIDNTGSITGELTWMKKSYQGTIIQSKETIGMTIKISFTGKLDVYAKTGTISGTVSILSGYFSGLSFSLDLTQKS
jgi:hypothetical protein